MTTALVATRTNDSALNTESAIVIPVKGEAANVSPLVFGMPDQLDPKGRPYLGLHDVALAHGKHLVAIFVDDSQDNLTGKAVKLAQHQLDEQCNGFCPHLTILHEHRTENVGRLAGAVIHGAKLATKRYGAKKIVVMDGDLQHPPRYILDLLNGLDTVDLVATTRYHKDGSAEGLSSTYRHLVSRGATYLVKCLFPYRLRRVSDPMTGYYGFRSDSVSLDKLTMVGFKVLFTTLKANSHLRRMSVPFFFGARLHGESKGDLREGIAFLKLVLKSRLESDKLSFVAGGGLIGLGGIKLLDWLVQGGLNTQAAYSIMLAITVFANFAWNRCITWRGHGKTRLHQQVGAFVVTRAVTLGGSWVAFWFLVSHLGVHYQVVNISCMALSTIVNYVTSKRIFGV